MVFKGRGGIHPLPIGFPCLQVLDRPPTHPPCFLAFSTLSEVYTHGQVNSNLVIKDTKQGILCVRKFKRKAEGRLEPLSGLQGTVHFQAYKTLCIQKFSFTEVKIDL